MTFSKGFGLMHNRKQLNEAAVGVEPFDKVKDLFSARKRNSLFKKNNRDGYVIKELVVTDSKITCVLKHNQENGNDPKFKGVSIARMVDVIRETVGSHTYNDRNAANTTTTGNGIKISAKTVKLDVPIGLKYETTLEITKM